MTATIHVCKTCQERDLARGAPDFAAALTAWLAPIPACGDVEIVLQQCLGTCAADANVALTAPGRWGWLFRGLRADQDLADIAAFLIAWRAAPQGLPVKANRPAGLRARTVGRLPPDRPRAEDVPAAKGGR